MDYQKRAAALLDEMIRHRRYLHRHAEVGLNLPQTASYVRAELEKLGYAPEEICRSEERRVGKECRSRWSPYH